jgi:hypothetical protein
LKNEAGEGDTYSGDRRPSSTILAFVAIASQKNFNAAENQSQVTARMTATT